MLFLVSSFLFVSLTSAHPQCLDYLPPFSPSTKLAYCSEYSDFTCCSSPQDENIASQASHTNISEAIVASDDPDLCMEYWKNVSCLSCSPYAAHLFDAEGYDTAQRALPGLCPAYCRSLYGACPRVADVIGGRRFVSESEFCEAARLSDVSYCYPDVKEVERANVREFGSFGCLCVQEVVSGLRNPVVLTHAGDGSNRLFIAEQVGIIHVMLPNRTILPEPFFDVQTHVVTSSKRGDERGFLGLAFHPNYTTNGFCFVYYCTPTTSAANHKIRVSRFNVSQHNDNRLDPTTEKVVIEVDQPAANHNGGQILFGTDGYLYVFLGDGGRGGDPFGTIGNGLDRRTLLGSILRLDVDTPTDIPYGIPPDNPFINDSTVKEEIYAYGVRNPWRCSVDRGDGETGGDRGRIFCGDVGQNRYEEIDILVKGGNFAWRGKEGYQCFDGDLCDVSGIEVVPIHVYDHSVGKSVTGGFVYRGCLFPNLNGKYIFGDYTSGRMFALTENKETGAWSSEQLCLGDSSICHSGLTGNLERSILSFGEDEEGELYVLVTDDASPTHTGGKVYHIIDPARRADPGKCVSENLLNYPPVESPSELILTSTDSTTTCIECSTDSGALAVTSSLLILQLVVPLFISLSFAF